MRRRHFIALGVVAAAGGGLGYWLRGWFVGTRPQDLPNSQETLEAMAAMIEPVLGPQAAGAGSVSLEPYRSLFQWRFENLPIERDRQTGFARLLNQLARDKAGLIFAECDQATRRNFLEAALDSPGGREAGLWLTGLIVRLFARTDAYRWMGYDTPPGTPRGLESYTEAPGR